MRALARALLVIASCGWPWASLCHAGEMRFCDEPAALSDGQKDRLFRFGAIIKAELEASGQRLALIARSGLDLRRFGIRYSHAGVSLRDGARTRWSVRQLYYACDEQRPRVFDEGISGFLLGLDDAPAGYVAVVLLPPVEAAQLERTVLDNRRALQLLGSDYSANAYPFSARYQNCNQWLIEMMASAWGRPDPGGNLRAQAQAWLKERGYRPTEFDVVFPPLAWLGAFEPWLHTDDHPSQDLDSQTLHVSMPASIEDFVRATLPGATRMEFCHAAGRVVIRRGWESLADGCLPGPDDTVVTLDQ